ncbi:MAG TPA: DUF4160 domain-containing protein [Pyrinomonadaceae bacterium]|nr:DUF4160 domain-containing protein [Pyrinomonadaceae bacterium]
MPDIAKSHPTYMWNVTIVSQKFWLEPVRLQRSGGFGSRELSRIEKLVAEQSEQLLKSWNEYFSR